MTMIPLMHVGVQSPVIASMPRFPGMGGGPRPGGAPARGNVDLAPAQVRAFGIRANDRAQKAIARLAELAVHEHNRGAPRSDREGRERVFDRLARERFVRVELDIGAILRLLAGHVGLKARKLFRKEAAAHFDPP